MTRQENWATGSSWIGNLQTRGKKTWKQWAVSQPPSLDLVNEPPPGADSYPFSGYSWAPIYTHQASQATDQALVNLLDWLTHSGQAYAAATGYVPLPPQIQQLARSMLQQVTGPGGARLLG